MQLTQYSDYSVRVMIYLAVHAEEWTSTQQISEAYGISQHHLVKVVNNLGNNDFIRIKRGRNGGIQLAGKPSEVTVGMIVRKTEQSFRLVECFDCETNTCPITGVCKLKPLLARALEAFLEVLDGTTLAQLVEDKLAYAALLRGNGDK